MDLDTLIEETRGALLAAIQRRDERRQREDAEIEALDMELHGLLLARDRREGKPTAARTVIDAGVIDTARLRNMYRTDAIMVILHEIARPAGPAEIAAMLRSFGRDSDTPEIVSAALQHLKSQGRVASKGRGQWVPTEGGA